MTKTINYQGMKNQGKDIEKEFERIAKRYMASRVCELLKVDPPTRVVRKGGSPIVTHTRSPFLDYVGTWTERQGRALHIELKSTQIPRLSINGKAHLTKQQVRNLRNRQLMGAACAVLWVYKGCMKFIPTFELALATTVGRKSFPWDHKGLIQVPIKRFGWDFMDTLRRYFDLQD